MSVVWVCVGVFFFFFGGGFGERGLICVSNQALEGDLWSYNTTEMREQTSSFEHVPPPLAPN